MNQKETNKIEADKIAKIIKELMPGNRRGNNSIIAMTLITIANQIADQIDLEELELAGRLSKEGREHYYKNHEIFIPKQFLREAECEK